jgi:hypothetical protein
VAHRLRLGPAIAITSFILKVTIATTALGGVPNDIPRIRSVLRAQQAAWNRGDIDGFMNGYARSPSTVAQQQKQIEALTTGLQKVSAQLEASKPAPQVVNNP